MYTILRPAIISDTVVDGAGIIHISGIDRITPLSEQVKSLERFGFKIYGNVSVVDTAPILIGDEAEVHFWRNIEYTSPQTLHDRYAAENTKPDLAALLAINGADPELCKKFILAVQWQGKDNEFFFLCLGILDSRRQVEVDRCGGPWD